MSLVPTCHPKPKDLDNLIKDLQLFLYSDSEVKIVFSPVPIVYYRSARKIKDNTGVVTQGVMYLQVYK